MGQFILSFLNLKGWGAQIQKRQNNICFKAVGLKVNFYLFHGLPQLLTELCNDNQRHHESRKGVMIHNLRFKKQGPENKYGSIISDQGAYVYK
jgi:hypothetical protein